jgi:hypothetical protein
MNGLAVVYDVQTLYEKAEPLYVKCLKVREKLLGVSHAETLDTMNNLAGLYCDQNEYDKAEPLYRNCLEQRRLVQGIIYIYIYIYMINYYYYFDYFSRS